MDRDKIQVTDQKLSKDRLRFFRFLGRKVESRGGGGSGVRGVKRERPRKFHDRRISTPVTLSFSPQKRAATLLLAK